MHAQCTRVYLLTIDRKWSLLSTYACMDTMRFRIWNYTIVHGAEATTLYLSLCNVLLMFNNSCSCLTSLRRLRVISGSTFYRSWGAGERPGTVSLQLETLHEADIIAASLSLRLVLRERVRWQPDSIADHAHYSAYSIVLCHDVQP